MMLGATKLKPAKVGNDVYLPHSLRSKKKTTTIFSFHYSYSTITSIYMQLCAYSHGYIYAPFCCSSAKPHSRCTRHVTLLHLFSCFCIIMFFNPFFLQLCIRSEPPLMPPRTPLRLWIREGERVVLKEFTDGGWGENF